MRPLSRHSCSQKCSAGDEIPTHRGDRSETETKTKEINYSPRK